MKCFVGVKMLLITTNLTYGSHDRAANVKIALKNYNGWNNLVLIKKNTSESGL